MSGRAKKFNRDTWTIIVEAVRIGMSQARAAQTAGVSEQTLYDWINKALNEPEKYPEHAEFHEALLMANADCERSLIQALHEAIDMDWKAALEILKTRFPKDWGKQVVHDTDWEEYIREHNLDPEKVRNAFSRIITEMVSERRAELGLDDPVGGGQTQAARPPDMDPAPGDAD